jgi:hypothetical protein
MKIIKKIMWRIAFSLLSLAWVLVGSLVLLIILRGLENAS